MSSRSKILAASFGFIVSYMVMRPLKRAASASSLRWPLAPVSFGLERGELGLEILLRGLEQVLAQLELACLGVELLAALQQAFQDGAFGGRGRARRSGRAARSTGLSRRRACRPAFAGSAGCLARASLAGSCAGPFQASLAGSLVAPTEPVTITVSRVRARGDRAGDVGIVEHLLRPGARPGGARRSDSSGEVGERSVRRGDAGTVVTVMLSPRDSRWPSV